MRLVWTAIWATIAQALNVVSTNVDTINNVSKAGNVASCVLLTAAGNMQTSVDIDQLEIQHTLAKRRIAMEAELA